MPRNITQKLHIKSYDNQALDTKQFILAGIQFQMMRLTQTIYQDCIEIFCTIFLNTMLWIYFYYVEVIILQWKKAAYMKQNTQSLPEKHVLFC